MDIQITPMKSEGVERHLQVSVPVEAVKAAEEKAALVVGHGIPLACYAINRLSGRRSDTLSIIASLSVIAGGYMTRDALLKGGLRSSRQPRDYFYVAGRRKR